MIVVFDNPFDLDVPPYPWKEARDHGSSRPEAMLVRTPMPGRNENASGSCLGFVFENHMDIGIVGVGNLGFALGSLWAEKGHHVCFSFSRSLTRLKSAAVAAGSNATHGTPVEAAQFGQIVLLAAHWLQVPQIVCELEPHLSGKPVMTCVVPWNSRKDGLALGADNSAAEEIARLAPAAHVVEALPFLAEGLVAQGPLLGTERPTVFCCGNEPSAKETVALLLEDLNMIPLDAGDVTYARFLEPAMALLWRLAIGHGEGTDIALKLLHRQKCGPWY